MIYGWDGASWQGVPDCAQLRRENHDFCIEKVTGEGDYINPVWRAVRDGCRAAGVLFGSYDWIRPQEWAIVADAIAGARDYLRVLGPRQAGELLTVDFEDPDWFRGPLGRGIEAAMKAYLYTLKDEGGQEVVVYTGPYYLQETGASGWDWLGRDFHLWQAAPGPGMMADDSFWPSTPAPFNRTLIHQHQWYAESGAIVGNFDRDRFQGTREELMGYGYPGEVTAAMVRKDPIQAIGEAVGVPNRLPFGPYGKSLGGGFRKTYEDAGENATGLYGYPVTEELPEDGITVQYFERARFEYHPDSGAITFGRVGAELARLRGLSEAA